MIARFYVVQVYFILISISYSAIIFEAISIAECFFK